MGALAASQSSSLTSTHSTLARSLMEAPKTSSLNAEHQRRADLIVANIMKGSSSPSTSTSYSAQSPQLHKTVLTSGPLYTGSSSPSWMSSYTQSAGPSSSSSSTAAPDSQPLNLSLKLPSSSPDRSGPATPVSHVPPHYFPLHAK